MTFRLYCGALSKQLWQDPVYHDPTVTLLEGLAPRLQNSGKRFAKLTGKGPRALIEIVSNTGLAVLLVAVILYDLKQMRLPNRLALLFVALFFMTVAWALPVDDVAMRLGASMTVLLLGMAANAAGVLGGGDVKILSALMLFIPLPALTVFALILSVSMFLGIIALLLLRRALRGIDTGWTGLEESGRYPMGVSIGLAGLAHLALSITGAR